MFFFVRQSSSATIREIKQSGLMKSLYNRKQVKALLCKGKEKTLKREKSKQKSIDDKYIKLEV